MSFSFPNKDLEIPSNRQMPAVNQSDIMRLLPYLTGGINGQTNPALMSILLGAGQGQSANPLLSMIMGNPQQQPPGLLGKMGIIGKMAPSIGLLASSLAGKKNSSSFLQAQALQQQQAQQEQARQVSIAKILMDAAKEQREAKRQEEADTRAWSAENRAQEMHQLTMQETQQRIQNAFPKADKIETPTSVKYVDPKTHTVIAEIPKEVTLSPDQQIIEPDQLTKPGEQGTGYRVIAEGKEKQTLKNGPNIDEGGRSIPTLQKPDGTLIHYDGTPVKGPIRNYVAPKANEPLPQDNLIPDPLSQSILGATGMSLYAFNILTNPKSGMLSRMPQATRDKYVKEAREWAVKNGVDTATLPARYEALTKALERNIMRYTQTNVAEGEVTGTLDTLFAAAQAAGFSSARLVNVIDKWLKGEVNDPDVARYALHLNNLQSQLAYYNASMQGKNMVEKSETEEAKAVIRNGIAEGGLTGMRQAVIDETRKMREVMQGQTESVRRQIWDLFGVGNQLKTPGEDDKREAARKWLNDRGGKK